MTEPLKLQPTQPSPAPSASSGSMAPTAPAAQSLPASARELRRQRARRLAIRFAIGVGVPTLIATVYTLAFASKQYDSVAVIAVESHEEHATTGRGRDTNAGNQRDARLLREHLLSRQMVGDLEGFAAHYRSADWWSALADDAGTEETYDYYRDKVALTGEPTSNVMHLRVRAFSAEQAHAYATALVAHASTWVDELSAKSAKELIEPAEAEVTRAKEALAAARAADPTSVEHELAEKQLQAAVESLQRARLDAAAAKRQLVIVSEPSKATDASRPRPAWTITTVLVTSAVLVSVLSLLGAAIREHANF
jgi:capsular polysaccharide transport system permease protein